MAAQPVFETITSLAANGKLGKGCSIQSEREGMEKAHRVESSSREKASPVCLAELPLEPLNQREFDPLALVPPPLLLLSLSLGLGQRQLGPMEPRHDIIASPFPWRGWAEMERVGLYA